MNNQPDLPDPAHPHLVEASGDDFIEAARDLQRRGAVIESISKLTGRNGVWVLRLRWPAQRRVTCSAPANTDQLGEFGKSRLIDIARTGVAALAVYEQ